MKNKIMLTVVVLLGSLLLVVPALADWSVHYGSSSTTYNGSQVTNVVRTIPGYSYQSYVGTTATPNYTTTINTRNFVRIQTVSGMNGSIVSSGVRVRVTHTANQ